MMRRSSCYISLTFVFVVLSACTLTPTAAQRPEAPAGNPQLAGKPISFAILEDYDKGEDLAEIALDFQLMQELEIDTLRCSFGWDDYEPEQGEYDFEWLEEFVTLADQHGIKIRPYIGYTPEWAGAEGSDDDVYWNNPPADPEAWYDFVYNLALTLKDHPNVLSYEIYNEINDPVWWDGSIEAYQETLKQASLAIRAADPDAQMILAGLVFPDDDWLGPITEEGYAQYYEITPFHAYPETWSEPETVVENYLGTQYQDFFVVYNNTQGEGEPLWINEMGYAMTPGRTEEQQANWFARAISTFLAAPEIEHIGVYEIKDLPQDNAVVGDEANYYLGLTYPDRTKKLSFYTVDMLTDLLDVGTITPADAEAAVTVTAGEAQALYHHLFKRPDGSQVLFVYDKSGAPTVTITLQTPGSVAYRYELNGNSAEYASFDGHTLSDLELSEGNVAIFRIEP
jgi:polysaccharide biosynthesis protein PslG